MHSDGSRLKGPVFNSVFNCVLILTLTNCPKFLIKVFFPKCSFSFLTTNKRGLVGKTSGYQCELPKPAHQDT